ncbi:class I SAM-dependent methyltransferase [Streptomyces sp. A012304]|uniref:class I SAM-dependent DNA methyltransferase n=1 Tax=Streptomyces sp. A012304 TaxID=375446 RepID=UPI00223274C0|nr:class I SAM-dependent methyltransferase [Streptomyces sp. A012304]GKQ40939.1 methyltransferase [Streptomyces sp. A012304]
MSEPNALAGSTDAEFGFVREVRASYDAIAEEYAREFPDRLGTRPLEAALLSGFAELVKARGGEPVADVGCGPGHVTARLNALGVPVFGVDVSPRMVALARRAHPELRFHVGSMESLDLPERTLGGLLALYSVIHVPDDRLPVVLAEFRRVLAPGGYLLLAFQTGDGETQRLTERFGREICLDYHWRDPETVAGQLVRAGLEMRARVVLEPDEGAKRPRAFLLAHRPG